MQARLGFYCAIEDQVAWMYLRYFLPKNGCNHTLVPTEGAINFPSESCRNLKDALVTLIPFFVGDDGAEEEVAPRSAARPVEDEVLVDLECNPNQGPCSPPQAPTPLAQLADEPIDT